MVDRDERVERPVLSGLVALVAVALTVGLILGVVALGATRVAGLGGDQRSGSTTAEESMYLPKPVKTGAPSEPLITLVPQPSETSNPAPPEPTKTKRPKKRISLSASQTAVSAMEQIDLTGVYPRGEGAVLQVQRFTDGAWRDFPVTVSVSDETFATYVQTSQPGQNRFRVVDTDSGLTSNEVRVTIG
ncbi:hypothetical protein [Nocardioides sp.]|uniref:hypothetical protein n=1 Tax=Nocardioides sp. TaxID=35761 RepID=UPI003566DFCA